VLLKRRLSGALPRPASERGQLSLQVVLPPDEMIAAVGVVLGWFEQGRDRLIAYYRFHPQEAVVVRSGPLKDLYGIFDRYVDEGGRVRILLSLVGYSAAVELESEQIAKV